MNTKTAVIMVLLGLSATVGADMDEDTNKDSGGKPPSLAQVLSVDDIGRELFNPVNTLWSIANDIEFRTYQGDLPEAGDQSNWTYLIRPSLPIPLSNGKNVLFRATIPLHLDLPAWQIPFGEPLFIQDFDYPDFRLRQAEQIDGTSGGFGSLHGHLGDISFDIAYGGVSDSGYFSMFGLATVLETSTNVSVGRGQWLLGPEVALGKQTDWGVYGAWLTHLVDVSGDSRVDDYPTSETQIDLIFTYGLGNGWQLFSSPRIVYDWEADSGNELLLPLGAGIAKTTRLGRTPFQFSLEIENYVVSPDRLGPEWLVTIGVTPVFTNPFRK